MKELLTTVQIFATFCVGVAALYIAHRQYKISRTKMLFDLSQERYSVYLAFNRLLIAAVTDYKHIIHEVWQEYYVARAKSRFLFGDEVFNYMQEVEQAIHSMRGAEQEYNKSGFVVAQLGKAGLVFAPYIKITMKIEEPHLNFKSQIKDFRLFLSQYFQ